MAFTMAGHDNQARLERMIRSTAVVLDKSARVLERTVELLKRSQELPRQSIKWPDYRIDENAAVPRRADNQ
jgi:hypothetical protein